MQHRSDTPHTPSAAFPALPLLLQAADRLAQGQAEQALRLALEGLAAGPDADLCNLAGICAATLGDEAQAEAFWRQATALRPAFAQPHFNLGILLAGRKDAAQAEQCYRQAIALDPGNAAARLNLGVLLSKAGRVDEAEGCYRRVLALDPGNAGAYLNLAVLAARNGRVDEAERGYRQAIALAPGDAATYSNLGALLAKLKRNEEAEQCYRQAIALNPGSASAHSNFVILLAGLKRENEAEQHYWQALALDPRNAEAHSNLGLVLETLGREEEALLCHRKAAELQPGCAEIYSNLANLLAQAGRANEAEQHYRQAIALHPRGAIGHSNLGVLLAACRRDGEAEACFRLALSLAPDYPLARLNLGFLLLAQARFGEGWAHHEARYSAELSDNPIALPRLPYPQWRGESLAGKSLLVWPEQGLGDGIQFCRYATLLKERGAAHITLVCRPPLKNLLQSLDGWDALMTPGEAAQALPPHDFWTFLLSIPLYCTPDSVGIPARIPYLFAAPERIARWSRYVPPGGFRVGLAWRGNPAHANDAYRSLPGLAALAPLWAVPGVRFVSLQKGGGEDEALHPPAGQPLTPLGSDLADFADTAAVVAQLDLVICVDTALAHLAGALGKPCWVMLPAHKTDWRWQRGRSDSPWYPGAVRLFRQQDGSDWQGVVAEIAQALKSCLKKSNSA
ncbi:MAG: tetratricopeptide repeat protein [Sulfuricellaceae bacterium]|nr:tetratricopeptide repeat protein [Sulfuricellaceae bacterium]